MSTPTELYCLVCKTRRPVIDVKIVESPFKSKTGREMTRSLWKATCGECHRQVNQFAKRPSATTPTISAEAPE